MKDQERRYNIEHRQNALLNVLHRPLDIAAESSRSEIWKSGYLNDGFR